MPVVLKGQNPSGAVMDLASSVGPADATYAPRMLAMGVDSVGIQHPLQCDANGNLIASGGSGGGGTPGGASGQLQYNSSSAFGGTGIYTDGTNLAYGAAPSGSPPPQIDFGTGNGFTVNAAKTGLIVSNNNTKSLQFHNAASRPGVVLASNLLIGWANHAAPLNDPDATQDIFLSRLGAGIAGVTGAGGASASLNVQGNLGIGNSTGVTNGAASLVNGVLISPAATAATPSIAAAGSDTNINLRLAPKGTGAVIITLAGVPIYANNAAASGGGLAQGSIYRTGADPDQVCIVH